MLVMEPDYLPIPEIFVLAMFIPHEDYTPFPRWGGVGGLATPLLSARGSMGGWRHPLEPPLVGVWGKRPRREKLRKMPCKSQCSGRKF